MNLPTQLLMNKINGISSRDLFHFLPKSSLITPALIRVKSLEMVPLPSSVVISIQTLNIVHLFN